VLHTITQAFGEVLRIVIFKKHGVQAMVEYPFQSKQLNFIKNFRFKYLKKSNQKGSNNP